MKIFLLTGLIFLSVFSVSCQQDGDALEQEQEIDRGDIGDGEIDQSDIHPGNKPSNLGGE